MLNHVVLFSLLPGVSPDGVEARAFHAAMIALPDQVPLIRSWHCGFNMVSDPQAADYVLVAGFASQEDLVAYFEHPAHLAVLKRLEGVATLVFGDIFS